MSFLKSQGWQKTVKQYFKVVKVKNYELRNYIHEKYP